uniref:STAR_dimer domain-containing protein n=1 Tax=Steinernema glaseri TaxID=37863 RepID=A0A1I7XYD4_9BILA
MSQSSQNTKRSQSPSLPSLDGAEGRHTSFLYQPARTPEDIEKECHVYGQLIGLVGSRLQSPDFAEFRHCLFEVFDRYKTTD